MTPEKQKAIELVESFGDKAILCCEEIIKTDMLIDEDVYVSTPMYYHYWKQVINEINLL